MNNIAEEMLRGRSVYQMMGSVRDEFFRTTENMDADTRLNIWLAVAAQMTAILSAMVVKETGPTLQTIGAKNMAIYCVADQAAQSFIDRLQKGLDNALGGTQE